MKRIMDSAKKIKYSYQQIFFYSPNWGTRNIKWHDIFLLHVDTFPNILFTIIVLSKTNSSITPGQDKWLHTAYKQCTSLLQKGISSGHVLLWSGGWVALSQKGNWWLLVLEKTCLKSYRDLWGKEVMIL